MQFTPSPTNEELLTGIALYAEEIATLRAENTRLRAALGGVVDSADQWARAQGATSDTGIVVSVDYDAIQVARAALEGAR